MIAQMLGQVKLDAENYKFCLRIPHMLVMLIQKIKYGKVSGICSIYPEYVHHAGREAMYYQTDLFHTIWETEVVPDEWHIGIIITL